ncbi:MAG: FHA domain-containing protein [Colwellia sp.]|nr:FHA domain-containing protein [Colwellia sp.]
MEIIIEEISRGHKLISQHKLSKDAILIGRGYQNDIILSDPHICPDHLQLTFDGEHWLIEDQGTINGSYLEDGKTGLNNHIINSGDIFSIGKSLLRIVFVNHPVAETVHFSAFENFINIMRHPVMLALSMSVFAFVTGYIFYLNRATEANFSQFLAPVIGMSLLFSAWPIGVALMSHLTKHEARIMTQLGISFAFFNLLWVSDIIQNIVKFNFSSNWPLSNLFSLIPIALAFCLFWLNSYIGFHMTARRRIVVSVGLTLLFFGGSYLVQLSNKPEFSARPHYDATIMTPGFMFMPSSDVDKFILDSEKLFTKAQKAAAKKKGE